MFHNSRVVNSNPCHSLKVKEINQLILTSRLLIREGALTPFCKMTTLSPPACITEY